MPIHTHLISSNDIMYILELVWHHMSFGSTTLGRFNSSYCWDVKKSPWSVGLCLLLVVQVTSHIRYRKCIGIILIVLLKMVRGSTIIDSLCSSMSLVSWKAMDLMDLVPGIGRAQSWHVSVRQIKMIANGSGWEFKRALFNYKDRIF